MTERNYLLKRARSGRFNFSFTSALGELEGSVVVQIEPRYARAEIVEAAHREVQALINDLITATDRGRRPD